jgi:hypothetical protein
MVDVRDIEMPDKTTAMAATTHAATERCSILVCFSWRVAEMRH